MNHQRLFTSEAVSEGHPDKVCDQVSDAVLDACLALDPQARVAIECFAAEQKLLIGGEIRFSNPLIQMPNVDTIARNVLKRIGYVDSTLGFSADSVTIHQWIQTQSDNIHQAVDKEETKAGDQGLMFGYATDETEGYMPLAIVIAQKLVRLASQLRKSGQFMGARPDMKSQVTINETYALPTLDHVVMSIQHDDNIDEIAFKAYVTEHIIQPVIQSFQLTMPKKITINPSGKFVIGGPKGDTGLTGRKIIVDTYGGSARHGGGAFSGKDASKVDRSAAYLARYIAKNLVAAGVAKKLEVQLAYVIGESEPVSISIFTFSTLKNGLLETDVLNAVHHVFAFKPDDIIRQFSLHKPSFSYEQLACYGHFGRPDMNLPWEQLDQVDKIREFLNI